MLCPKCKNKLTSTMDSCPVCGTPISRKWYQKNSPVTIVIMIAALAFLAVAIFFFLNPPFDSPSSNNSDDTGVIISLSEFNEIENGMNYEQVCEIIGGEGTLFSESQEKDSPIQLAVYTWNGESMGSSASFTFQNGELIQKAQLGLT